jgi:hypothetical protein
MDGKRRNVNMAFERQGYHSQLRHQCQLIIHYIRHAMPSTALYNHIMSTKES